MYLETMLLKCHDKNVFGNYVIKMSPFPQASVSYPPSPPASVWYRPQWVTPSPLQPLYDITRML